jgi:hypothetical protein
MRGAIASLTVICVALVAIFALSRADDTDQPSARQRPAEPGYGQLARVAERINQDRVALEIKGIFLEGAGVGSGCASVSLANPTAPNTDYMQRRYPGACVESRPMGAMSFCDGTVPEFARGGHAKVPNVSDLGLVEASRRILAADLTFTATCPGRARDVEWVPSGPADELVRVVAQCPPAGERVRRGTEVALQARATLPGGFEYSIGSAGDCAHDSGSGP